MLTWFSTSAPTTTRQTSCLSDIFRFNQCTHSGAESLRSLIGIAEYYHSLFPLNNTRSGKYWRHGEDPQAHHHLSGFILTLFFWQMSQRDHAVHCDKTQSTGWTTTCPPTDRAWRPGGSSLLAVVALTLLRHADKGQIKTDMNRYSSCFLLLSLFLSSQYQDEDIGHLQWT